MHAADEPELAAVNLDGKSSIVLRDLTGTAWFSYLHEYQRDLFSTAIILLEKAETEPDPAIKDYGYIIFSASKAYEGFLKQYFIDLELLPRHQVEHRYFRIGRSLNPDVSSHQRDEDWVYDNLEHRCGRPLARELWDTWLECRNHIFHYFPHKYKITQLPQARRNVARVLRSVQQALLCSDLLEEPSHSVEYKNY
jgi:hypothetical protein